MGSIDGKSILITGGGSGIGKEAARYFVDKGAKVTICGRRPEKISATIEWLGDNCLGVVADVTKSEDRERLIDSAVEHGGGLDALISSAGNMYRGLITEVEENELIDIFHTNVISGMMLTGLAVPHLEKVSGSILFIGSVHNRRAFPGASPYASSKAALEGLTRVLAGELGEKKIRVNCIVPGAVFTEINQRAGLFDDQTALKRLESMSSLHALGRIGTTREIAQAMEYLILADWTTGAILDVDGGLGLGLTAG